MQTSANNCRNIDSGYTDSTGYGTEANHGRFRINVSWFIMRILINAVFTSIQSLSRTFKKRLSFRSNIQFRFQYIPQISKLSGRIPKVIQGWGNSWRLVCQQHEMSTNSRARNCHCGHYCSHSFHDFFLHRVTCCSFHRVDKVQNRQEGIKMAHRQAEDARLPLQEIRQALSATRMDLKWENTKCSTN